MTRLFFCSLVILSINCARALEKCYVERNHHGHISVRVNLPRCCPARLNTADWTNYHMISERKTFTDAWDFCRKHGLELAIIKSQEENNALMEAFRLTVFKRAYYATAAVTDDSGGNSVWYWYPNKNDTLDFNYWGRGEPSDPEEHCMGISTYYRTYHWFCVNCAYKRPFICQKPICKQD